jgi:tetrahydromethanopterin S-methyltransferase subunit G
MCTGDSFKYSKLENSIENAGEKISWTNIEVVWFIIKQNPRQVKILYILA